MKYPTNYESSISALLPALAKNPLPEVVGKGLVPDQSYFASAVL
uniref:Uncharacterized protein n=1 Tax=Arundo donax TaxID=35708 RepID=A0A0A9AVF4_ARUDO